MLHHSANPLNILIPAYEALWQAVLNGLFQQGFRKDHIDAKTWHQQLQAFLEVPTVTAFDNLVNKVTIRHLVAEIIRLYPPTKRIKGFTKANCSTLMCSSFSETPGFGEMMLRFSIQSAGIQLLDGRSVHLWHLEAANLYDHQRK